MATIHFALRPSSRPGRHPGSLVLRVVHDRKSRAITLPVRLYPEEWNPDTLQVILPPDDLCRAGYLQESADKIAQCIRSVNDHISHLEKQGRYTAAEVISRYRLHTDESKLMGYAENLAMEAEKAGQYRLAESYRTVTAGLVQYNKGVDIPLRHLNACLVKSFETHLMEKGRKPNTISYYMRNLRAIYNKAVACGRVPARREHPFAGVYTKVKATAKRALTEEETTLLYHVDFGKLRDLHLPDSRGDRYADSLHDAWKLFMFCFLAQGMSFIDLAHLRKENIRNGVCTYYRHKTRQQVEVTVNEGMQQIIDSFADSVKDSPYLFPILKDEGRKGRTEYTSALRTQNRRLKALARLAGIRSCVTTHVARHTFATITRDGGLPAGVISQMLGHSTEKMTHNYFASLDQSLLGEAYHILTAVLNRLPARFPPSPPLFR